MSSYNTLHSQPQVERAGRKTGASEPDEFSLAAAQAESADIAGLRHEAAARTPAPPARSLDQLQHEFRAAQAAGADIACLQREAAVRTPALPARAWRELQREFRAEQRANAARAAAYPSALRRDRFRRDRTALRLKACALAAKVRTAIGGALVTMSRAGRPHRARRPAASRAGPKAASSSDGGDGGAGNDERAKSPWEPDEKFAETFVDGPAQLPPWVSDVGGKHCPKAWDWFHKRIRQGWGSWRKFDARGSLDHIDLVEAARDRIGRGRPRLGRAHGDGRHGPDDERFVKDADSPPSFVDQWGPRNERVALSFAFAGGAL